MNELFEYLETSTENQMKFLHIYNHDYKCSVCVNSTSLLLKCFITPREALLPFILAIRSPRRRYSFVHLTHCCPGQLFSYNVHPGRHLRRGQMLLHKPAGSHCGFSDIKQAAFLGCSSVTLQRKPHCIGAGCDTSWSVGLALDCVCGFISV